MSRTTGKRSDVKPEHYLPSEVASLFRVYPKTVARWAERGWLTSIRTLGGHRRFPREEVDRLLREGLPAEAFEEQDVEDEQSSPAAAVLATQEVAALRRRPGPVSDNADVSAAARHPINALVEDHFAGDAVEALLELAGRYGIAVAYLDRPWFTRYLGRALIEDEWRRIAAELNDFCAVLDDLCAEDLEVYADLVLKAASVVRVPPPADLIGDYEAALIATGFVWTGNTAPTARARQRADTAPTVLDTPTISTEPGPGIEPASGAASESRIESATPDAGGPLPISLPRRGREERIGPQPLAAQPARGTTEPHQLVLSPPASRGQQAPSTGGTTEQSRTESQPESQAGSYSPKSPSHPAELEMSVEVLRERYTEGESVPSIARRMGLTPRQVYLWMRHERINRRPPGGSTWDSFPIELQELREWYEAGETISGLARALEVSNTAVKMRLAESGATLRSREDPGSQRIELPVPSPVLRTRYEAGESLYDWADELGVATGTIKLRLLEAGTKMRPVGGPTRSHQVELPVPVERLLERVESGESVHSLALELGVPRNTLRGHLEAAAKYGPPQPGQPHGTEQPPVGQAPSSARQTGRGTHQLQEKSDSPLHKPDPSRK